MQALLQSLHAELSVDIEVLHTTGDRILDVPLAMIGDRGLFTKEIDAAVLDGRAHCAVHSFKDVPTKLTDGLTLAAVLVREDARDAYLPAPGRPHALRALPTASRVGTSSLRRRALLLAARSDLVVDDLRGNLDTRFRKLHDGEYDAILLALAGVRRFGRESEVGELLGSPHWLPAAGQGALAMVARMDDHATLARLRPLDHEHTRAATTAERAFLGALEGGCQIPIGALATVANERLSLEGLVAAVDGSVVIRGEAVGAAGDPEAVGRQLARQLIEQGADDVLRAVRTLSPRMTPPAAP